MRLVHASLDQLDDLMAIVNDAQQFLASRHIDQWQNGYPTKHIIQADIESKCCYVLVGEENNIFGMVMLSTNNEPTYKTIFHGSWLTDIASYGVIHRLAIASKYRSRGYGKHIINLCEILVQKSKRKSMRMDTHKDNKLMQGLLKSIGYVYCGVIFLDNGDSRLAYEKVF